MQRRMQITLILTIIMVIFSVWKIYPPFDIKDAQGNVLEKGKIKLGLDLQGGMYLKLAIDTDKMPASVKLEEAVTRALEILRNRIDALGVSEPLITRSYALAFTFPGSVFIKSKSSGRGDVNG